MIFHRCLVILRYFREVNWIHWFYCERFGSFHQLSQQDQTSFSFLLSLLIINELYILCCTSKCWLTGGVSSQLVDISIYFPVKDKRTGMPVPYVELAMTWAGVFVLCLMPLYGAFNYPKLFRASKNYVWENVLSTSDLNVERKRCLSKQLLGLWECDLSESYLTALLTYKLSSYEQWYPKIVSALTVPHRMNYFNHIVSRVLFAEYVQNSIWVYFLHYVIFNHIKSYPVSH